MTEATRAAISIDRTIGLGVVFAVLVQTGGALMWAGGANARIGELETEVQVAFDVNKRLARLEGETAVMRDQLSRIEGAVLNEN